jgi:pimeloyl-ACP methyl ester carboxylesterase
VEFIVENELLYLSAGIPAGGFYYTLSRRFLGLEKAHVMGYSMGGSIANKVRQLHPDRLQTTVIGGSGWLKEGDPALAGMTGDAIADELEQNGSFEMMLRKFTENREPPSTDEEIARRNENMLRGNDPQALAAVMRAWHEFAVPGADLSENAVPTIAIVGENDPLKVQVDAMEEVMGNLEVVVIEGATHGALSDPTFLEILVDFLGRHGMSAQDAAEPQSN